MGYTKDLDDAAEYRRKIDAAIEAGEWAAVDEENVEIEFRKDHVQLRVNF